MEFYKTLGTLADFLEDFIWPQTLITPEDLPDFLSRVYVMDYANSHAKGELKTSITLAFRGELSLSIPGFKQAKIILKSEEGADITFISITIDFSNYRFLTIRNLSFAFRFHSDLLRPARLNDVDPLNEFVELSVSGSIYVTKDYEVDISGFDAIDLSPAEIGQTGIVISASGVKFDLSQESSISEILAAGYRKSFVGIYLGLASIKLPDFFPDLISDDLRLRQAVIGSGGVSGALEASYSAVFNAAAAVFEGRGAGELFGVPFAFHDFDNESAISLEIRQNALTNSRFTGKLFLPFFEKLLDISLGFDVDGQLFVGLQPEDGLFTFHIDNILQFELDTIKFDIGEGIFTIIVGGKITPQLSIGGADWPSIEVEEIRIDSSGNIYLEGGWLDIPRQFSQDLYGFQFEITKLGFGKSNDGGKWIGFSGGIQLVEGITAGGSVEGLRITWYDDDRATSLSLNGLGVEFEVPQVLYFKGEVSLINLPEANGEFRGAITLDLMALDMELDGELVIGHRDGESYFAIFLEMNLPVGIPLWATGLGLYGISGLYAHQYEPDKSGDMQWYSIDRSKSWYHKGDIGVTDLDKWAFRKGSLALGAGVSIGTLPDNGYILSGRMLFAIIFPGPILLFEGRANMLGERVGVDEEGKFQALAVLDFRAGDFTFGLNASYKFGSGGELIDISAGAEAFFSLSDFWAWHLYIGKKEPKEQRVRAELIKIFEANAYLMLEMRQLAFGAWIGYAADWEFWELRVILEAWMEGNVVLSWMPPHVHGDFGVHGKVYASAFGYGIGFSIDVLLAADIFDPFHLLAELTLAIYLPWPVPEIEVTIALEWGPEPIFPALPHPLKEVSIEHLKVGTNWPLPAAEGLLLPDLELDGGYLWEAGVRDLQFMEYSAPPFSEDSESIKIPIIPLDGRPSITFNRPVNDDALVGFNVEPNEFKERIGDPNAGEGPVEVRYGLKGLALHKWNGTREGGNWEWIAKKGVTGLVGEFDNRNIKELFGAWASIPQSEDGSTSKNPQTKLSIWSRNPYDYTRFTGRTLDDWIADNLPDYPCPPDPGDTILCCDFEDLAAGFVILGPWDKRNIPELSFKTVGGSFLQITNLAEPIGEKTHGLCLTQADTLEIRFSQVASKTELLLDYPDSALGTHCLDFYEFEEGNYPNPTNFDQTDFSVRSLDFSAEWADEVMVATYGDSQGLLVSGHIEITLSCPARVVRLILWHPSDTLLFLRTFDAQGQIITEEEIESYAYPQSLVLTAEEEGQFIESFEVIDEMSAAIILQLCYDCPIIPTVIGFNQQSQHIRPTSINWPTVVFSNQLQGVRIDGTKGTCLVEICTTFGASQQAIEGQRQAYNRLQEMVASWSAEGELLNPNTVYRLSIITSIHAEGIGELEGRRKEFTMKEFAYFQTDGPPGFTDLTTPLGQAEKTPFAPSIGLNDLSLYVRQTLPRTIVAAGEKPFIPRPVYRAYDVGLEFFRGDEVELMYRLSGGGLGLYLFDRNDRPPRGIDGQIIIPYNQSGNAKRISLSESEILVTEQISRSNCLPLDPVPFARAKILQGFNSRQVLEADTLYKARLIPLILFDDFSRGLEIWQFKPEDLHASFWQVSPDTLQGRQANISGHVVTLDLDSSELLEQVIPGVSILRIFNDNEELPEEFIIRDLPATENTIVLAGQPTFENREWEIDYWAGVLQIGDFGEGVPSPDIPNKPGTMLLAGNSNWSNYRFSVWMRSIEGQNSMGIVFCYQSEDAHYRFSMNATGGYRRIDRLDPLPNSPGSHTTILNEDSFKYELNRDYFISVEVLSDSIKVYQDGELIFDINDTTHLQGKVGLYCWKNPKTLFREARVDSFMEQATELFRFDFTTSFFTNFYHHIHSVQDASRDKEIQALPEIQHGYPLISVAQERTAEDSEAEDRDFQKLAEVALGASVFQRPDKIEIYRICENAGQGHFGIKAFLIRSPEPVDWRRTEVDILHSDRNVRSSVQSNEVKITEVGFEGDTEAMEGSFDEGSPIHEFVKLLLRDQYNLSRHRVQYSQFPAGLDLSLANRLLLYDEFDWGPKGVIFEEEFGQGALDKYRTLIEPALVIFDWDYNIEWKEDDHFIEHTQSIPSDALRTGERTFNVLAVTGIQAWKNIRVRSTLYSSSNTGAMGVVFGFKDLDNYYQVELYRELQTVPFFNGSDLGSPRMLGGIRLRKKSNGNWSNLWTSVGQYRFDATYLIVIAIFENTIVGHVTEQVIREPGAALPVPKIWDFSYEEDDQIVGQVGFSARRNSLFRFSRLLVETLDVNPLIWAPTLANLDDFEIFDDANIQQGPSNWSAREGVLTQDRPIQIDGENALFSVGTLALGKVQHPLHFSAIYNHRISISSDISGGFGFVFNYQDENNYCRFSTFAFLMNHGSGSATSLIRMLDHVVEGEHQNDWYEWSTGDFLNEEVLVVEESIKIYVLDGKINLYIGDALVADVVSPFNEPGRLGFHTYQLPTARFSDLQIERLDYFIGDWQITGTTPDHATTSVGWKVGREIFHHSEGVGQIVDGFHQGTSAITGRQEWDDYRLRAIMSNGLYGAIGLYFHFNDYQNFYRVLLDHNGTRLERMRAGILTVLVEKNGNDYTYEPETPFTFIVDAVSDTIGCWLNDSLLLSYPMVDRSRGKIGIFASGTINAKFESVEVTAPPLEAYLLARGTQEDSLAFPQHFKNFILELYCEFLSVVIRFRDQGENNTYLLHIKSNGDQTLIILKQMNINLTLFGFTYEGTYDEIKKVTVVVQNEKLEVYVNDIPCIYSQALTAEALGVGGIYIVPTHGNIRANVFKTDIYYDKHLLFEDFMNQIPDRWAFIDEVDSLDRPSVWRVEDGSLQQLSDIHGFNWEGTCALTGENTWDNYRVFLFIEDGVYLSGNRSIGLVVRWQDLDNHYKFYIHRRTDGDLSWSFRKRINGINEEVDQGEFGSINMAVRAICIDCEEDRYSIFVNGKELASLVSPEPSLNSGKVGIFCAGYAGVICNKFVVSPITWNTYYTFGTESKVSAGTQVKIHSGSQNSISNIPRPEEIFKHVAIGNEVGSSLLSAIGATVRLVSPEQKVLHSRYFIPDSSFEKVSDVEILRKADGTEFVIIKNGEDYFSAGTYNLKLNYRRDNASLEPDSLLLSEGGGTEEERVSILIFDQAAEVNSTTLSESTKSPYSSEAEDSH